MTKKPFGELAARVKNIEASSIRRMAILGKNTPGSVSLGQGVPDAQTPRYIRDGVIKLLKDDMSVGKYSLQPGLPALRAFVAKNISKKGKFKVDPEANICITAGAIEALAISVSTIVQEGDEVILFDPGYPPYIEQITFAGGTPVLAPLDKERHWKVDAEALKRAITPKTKALIVCSPSNPTGVVMDEEDIRLIASLAKEHNFFVIADLTYEFLTYERKSIPSLLDYPDIRDRLLICYSFSKEFCMTGWRVGYLYAPENVMEQAQKVHDAFVICAPRISQHAALIALTHKSRKKAAQHAHKEMQAKRDLCCKRLDRLSDLFSYTKPEGAYYILAEYKKTNLDSWDFAIKMLKEAKVVCVPGSSFGAQGERHVRFSFGASKEHLNKAFDRLEKWNKKL